MPLADLRDTLQAALAPTHTLERELGGGGMSRVFVARENALGRTVVVKVLAPERAEGISSERFAREIRLAATLQHANIVPLLNTGAINGLPYYTMPYVDGQSLRARLEREGALSARETVSVLRDVARALAYAHSRGVVHRDIKPENVLLSGGAAVVTDFGIAKAVESARTIETTRGDRVSADLTAVGITIGTPAYMAPEQATGGDVDGRTDIYALGCMAYEMLAGAPPFAGRAPLLMIAAHVGETPAPLASRRRDVPSALAELVESCLAKAPNDRPPTADDVLRLIEAATTSGEVATPASPAVASPRTMGRRVATVVVVLLVVAGAAFVLFRPRNSPPIVMGATSQVTASPELEVDVAISPDGKLVAYAAEQAKGFRILVRQLAGGRTVMVGADTGGAQRWPRWSPDGSRLIYSSEGTVYEVPALGGTPRAIVSTDNDYLRGNPTAVYSPDGAQIAWADSAGILVRAIQGGAAARRIATGFELHSPAWSPDGRRLVYVSGNRTYVSIIGNTSPSSLWVVPVDGGEPVRVTEALHLNVSPIWTTDGRSLLYVSNASGTRDIWQLPLNREGKPASEPARLTTGLEPYSISLSADGTRLAYGVLRLRANIWTAPISPTGTTPVSAAREVTRENQRVEGVSLSPDGKWIVYDANRRGNADIFRIPVTGGEPMQLTNDPADDFEPVWSPNGKRIAFYSARTGTRDIYTMDADGGSLEHVTALPGHERFPTWSPDGSRIAFAWNASGVEELYVVTRQGSGWSAPTRLTTGGAGYPRWSPDGKVLSAISQGRVIIVPAGGGESRVLVDPRATEGSAVFTDWGRDPSVVYYQTINQRRLQWRFWSVSLAGGAPRLVFSSEGPGKQTGGVTFSTDGRRLFYTVSTDEADVWTMEMARR